MNKPLRRIAIFCGLLVLALLIRDNWLQYAQADKLQSDKQNPRVAIERYAQPRGDIIVDGKSITGSVATDGTDLKYKRTWKDGPMWSPVTGYASQLVGASQIESIEDGILTGNDDRLFFRRTLDMITGKKKEGGNVVTTLNAAAQKAAYDGLKNRGKGAAVAIDPKTGAILAMASHPVVRPVVVRRRLRRQDGDTFGKRSTRRSDQPLTNRALRETYPPGSTFKIVTAAAALEQRALHRRRRRRPTPPLP